MASVPTNDASMAPGISQADALVNAISDRVLASMLATMEQRFAQFEYQVKNAAQQPDHNVVRPFPISVGPASMVSNYGGGGATILVNSNLSIERFFFLFF